MGSRARCRDSGAGGDLVKTATNTPTPIAAPSEREPIDRLVNVLIEIHFTLERCAIALERITSDVPLKPPAKPEPEATIAEVYGASAAKVLEPRKPLAHVFLAPGATCAACWLGEGTLTSECPGEKPLPGFAGRVYKGEIDFVGGEWRPSSLMAKLARVVAPVDRDLKPANVIRNRADGNAHTMPRPTPEQLAAGTSDPHEEDAGGSNGVENSTARAVADGLQTLAKQDAALASSAAHAQTTMEMAVDLDAREGAKRLLGDELFQRVYSDVGLDAGDAKKLKAIAVQILGEPGFVQARDRVCVAPGKLPTSVQARALVAELVAESRKEALTWA